MASCLRGFGRNPLSSRRISDGRDQLSAPSHDREPLYNVANIAGFEWSSFIVRAVRRSSFCQLAPEGSDRASRFVADDSKPNGSLMRIRRRVATPEADGGAHGPAHGSSSAASARIVRDDEVQPTASDRGLRPPRADAAPQLALDAGGRAAIDDAKDGDGNRR